MTIADDMTIRSIAPWFGAKRTLAPVIVRELGASHKAYWEPFCGSMAVLMSKPESRMETVNDLHGDLINMARVIQDAKLGPAMYRLARRMMTADDELTSAETLIRHDDYEGDEPDVCRALAFFVSSWMGRNGEVGLKKNERGRTLAVRWSCNGGDPATRFAGAVSSIPAWRRRLRNVTVLRRDAFAVLDSISDDNDTAIYCDPPYLVKSDEYLHDFGPGFMGADDHERLAAALRRFTKARVVCSYYEHPRLSQLYPPGWTKRIIETNKHLANQTKGAGAKKALEVLLINGASYASTH